MTCELIKIGEEAKNPQKSIPLSLVICLSICFLAYTTVSATITLICPYFLLNPNTPITDAFDRVGLGWAATIITVGAIFALLTSLLGYILNNICFLCFIGYHVNFCLIQRRR